MDFIHESVALGVDILILGLCVREYVHYKNTAKVLRVSVCCFDLLPLGACITTVVTFAGGAPVQH